MASANGFLSRLIAKTRGSDAMFCDLCKKQSWLITGGAMQQSLLRVRLSCTLLQKRCWRRDAVSTACLLMAAIMAPATWPSRGLALICHHVRLSCALLQKHWRRDETSAAWRRV